MRVMQLELKCTRRELLAGFARAVVGGSVLAIVLETDALAAPSPFFCGCYTDCHTLCYSNCHCLCHSDCGRKTW